MCECNPNLRRAPWRPGEPCGDQRDQSVSRVQLVEQPLDPGIPDDYSALQIIAEEHIMPGLAQPVRDAPCDAQILTGVTDEHPRHRASPP